MREFGRTVRRCGELRLVAVRVAAGRVRYYVFTPGGGVVGGFDAREEAAVRYEALLREAVARGGGGAGAGERHEADGAPAAPALIGGSRRHAACTPPTADAEEEVAAMDAYGRTLRQHGALRLVAVALGERAERFYVEDADGRFVGGFGTIEEAVLRYEALLRAAVARDELPAPGAAAAAGDAPQEPPTNVVDLADYRRRHRR